MTVSIAKTSFEDSLQKNIILTGSCTGCGACVVSCPYVCLEYVDDKPVLMRDCKVCGICAQVCPQCDWPLPGAESFVFGRERSEREGFGIFRRVAVGRAKIGELLNGCQDGGIATALLVHALDKGLVDCAVVSGVTQEKPFYPVPRVATSFAEILKCAGTRYFYSLNLTALAEALKQKRRSIAFVGTPCQILAVRKIQMLGLKKYVNNIKILVGLMCSQCFDYKGLMETHICEKLGIDLSDIKSINIKGKMMITTKTGPVTMVPLSEVKLYARESCMCCSDFSSELADLSIGGLGLNKWSFVIVRTERGEALFSDAEKAGIIVTRSGNEEPNALKLLQKLSKKKSRIHTHCESKPVT